MANEFSDDTLLARWLNGQLTEEERQELELHPDYTLFQKIADGAKDYPIPNYSKAEAWERLNQEKLISKKPRPIVRRSWMSIAASLLIISLTFLFWYFNQSTKQIQTFAFEYKQVDLPDGSFIQLQPRSTLNYNKKNWIDNRIIQGFQGEAYFDVTPGSPFMIHTENGLVKVLGTSFTIWTHQKQFEVKCHSGSVEVRRGNKAAIIQKSERIWSPSIDSLLMDTTSSDIQVDWEAKESRFSDVPVHLVLQKVERQFDVNINIENIPNKLYNGGYPHNNLEVAIKLICDPMSLTYTFENAQNISISSQ